MLASQGFPLYGHSPPAGFLAEYAPSQPCRIYGARKTLTSRSSSPCLPIRQVQCAAPRPCLRPAAPGATAPKKRVVFADDHGYSLTQVRVMWEPSDVPPHWSIRPPPVQPPSAPVWEITFPQPASDYVDFRRKINEENVSLENVIVKEKEGFLIGTVKVKNLDFQKEVLVRWTADNWITTEDAFCSFVDMSVGASGAYTIYDTFSFKVLLPVSSRRLDFCVCFRCQNTEYWDNNGGCNYTVKSKDDSRSCSPPPVVVVASKSPVKPGLWSEYASWHGPCDVPYW